MKRNKHKRMPFPRQKQHRTLLRRWQQIKAAERERAKKNETGQRWMNKKKRHIFRFAMCKCISTNELASVHLPSIRSIDTSIVLRTKIFAIKWAQKCNQMTHKSMDEQRKSDGKTTIQTIIWRVKCCVWFGHAFGHTISRKRQNRIGSSIALLWSLFCGVFFSCVWCSIRVKDSFNDR